MGRRERHDESRNWYPLALVAGLAAVLALGTWGFARWQSAAWPDHVYRALQLFVLESGDGLVAPLPWQLEVARLAAPALTVTSTVIAAAALSRNRVDRLRARRRRHHVVVCGLDRHAAAALALHDAGVAVVGVEADAATAGVRHCRHVRVPVVVGDPRDPFVLADAGVSTADHLVITDPALDVAGRVALAAVGLVEGREGTPLTIHLEIGDPALAALLRALKLSEHQAPSWQVEELDLADAGARVMLDELAPWPGSATSAEVVVVGRSPLGMAVAREARRRWVRSGRAAEDLTLSLLDETHPVQRHGLDDRSVTAVYVCDPDETRALTTSLVMTRTLPGAPVLVRLERARAFGELVRRDAASIHVISLDQAVLTPAVLLDSTTERVARALHDSYRRAAPPDDPSAVPWEQLPEQLRRSNRAQAGHVADKVRATHRVLLPDDGEPADAFTEDEVDGLGRLEHERWVEERRAAGWTAGPRDPERRTTPYLVPWESLSDEVREIDRQFVRALPGILADAGLVVRRRGRGVSSTRGSWPP
jgi:voltage-gated potassium channel Kch